MTKEEFINRAIKIYGDKYDYSLIPENPKLKDTLRIICPIHGEFQRTGDYFISKKLGCPQCGQHRNRYTTESFIEAAKKVNGDKYTYEHTVYVNYNKKLTITCPEHGDFEITPSHFLDGQGCPVCRYIKSSAGRRRSLEEVIAEARKVHGDKYDYSMITEYKNDRIKYPIICPEHGVFYQTFNNHIKGEQGCPKCGVIKCGLTRRLPFEEFVKKANEIHNNYYQYRPDLYTKTDEYAGIICPKHGLFYQKASNHISLKQGCPKCCRVTSDGEKELLDYIKSLIPNEEIIENTRSILAHAHEIDIYIPGRNLAFEYDGLRWHSSLYKDSGYHLDKTRQCESKGIRLIHIFEDEWIFKHDIVKSMIKNMLGITETRIYARQCKVINVSSHDARLFIDSNHLQGACSSNIKLGLEYNGELVSVMTFGKSRHFVGNGKHQWELLRFCNKINTNVVGGASKLFSAFLRQYQPENIVSYADKRWSVGNVYNKLGFEKYNESKPNYYYVINNKRIYRFNMRKSVLKKKYGCPDDMTEKAFCESKGWARIYDCGCLCYEWKKTK